MHARVSSSRKKGVVGKLLRDICVIACTYWFRIMDPNALKNSVLQKVLKTTLTKNENVLWKKFQK